MSITKPNSQSKKIKFTSIIDADLVREQLTALTKDVGNDGSAPKVRSEVLKLLKETSKEGREKAKPRLPRTKCI